MIEWQRIEMWWKPERYPVLVAFEYPTGSLTAIVYADECNFRSCSGSEDKYFCYIDMPEEEDKKTS